MSTSRKAWKVSPENDQKSGDRLERQETSFGGKEHDLTLSTPHRASCALLTFAALLFVALEARGDEPARASGDEPELRGSEVIYIVPAKREAHADASQALDEALFATRIRVDERQGERRDVSELLSRSVGVGARSLGGLGSFSSISVRGASPGHTQVLVDGIPLSRIASVSANLGQYDLTSFDLLELYRGGVPVSMGGAGVGGALNLRTALGAGPDGKRFTLLSGMGSYGARQLRMRYLGGERGRDGAFQLSMGYAGATGDFEYFDDRGTPLNPGDDQSATRLNNHYDRVDLLARGQARGFFGGLRSQLQVQGLPGDAHDQALEAELRTGQLIADLGYEETPTAGDSLRLRSRSYASVELQQFDDPASEVGLLPQRARYMTTSVGQASGGRWRLSSRQHLDAQLEGRVDWFEDRSEDQEQPGDRDGNRQALALALADSIERPDLGLAIELALRAELLRTAPGADDLTPDEMQAESRRELALSPRVSGRWLAGDELAIKGSAGRYLRVPTLLESFGDRGFLIGNSQLVAERGTTADLGAVWAPARARGAVDRMYLEASAFASASDDTIVFVNRNGLVAQAINVAGARSLGLELVASARFFERLTFNGNYAALRARNQGAGLHFDKQLPGRPAHRLYGRLDWAIPLAAQSLVLWSELSYLSGNYVDELNANELPARTLLGAGLKLWLGQDWLVGVEGKNLSNLRRESVVLDPAPSPELMSIDKALSDVHGFPLPGRAFYLTLQWSH